MRSRMLLIAIAVIVITSAVLVAQNAGKQHMNPMVDLLLQHKPVFGVYLPTAANLPNAAPRGAQAGRGGGGGGRGAQAARKVADGYPQQEDPCGEAAGLVKNPPKVEPLT